MFLAGRLTSKSKPTSEVEDTNNNTEAEKMEENKEQIKLEGEDKPLFSPPSTHLPPSIRCVMDPQQRGEEIKGARLFLVAEDEENGFTLHAILQPLTPEASKGRI